MENFKKYLNNVNLSKNQPVSGDRLIFTINETLDIEVDVIDHRDGSVLLDLDETAISVLEDCGCVIEDDDEINEAWPIAALAGAAGRAALPLATTAAGAIGSVASRALPIAAKTIGNAASSVAQSLSKTLSSTGSVSKPKQDTSSTGGSSSALSKLISDATKGLQTTEQTFVPGPMKAGTPGPTTGISSDPGKLYTNQATAVPTASTTPADLNLGTAIKGGEKQTPSGSLPSSADAASIFGATASSGSGNLKPASSAKSINVPVPTPKPMPTNTSRPTRSEYSVTGKMPTVGKANIPTGSVNPNLLAGIKSVSPMAKPIAQPSAKSGIEAIKPPPNIAKAKGPSTAATGSMPYLREDIEDLKRLSGIKLTESVKENIKKSDIQKIHDANLSQKPDASLEEEDTKKELEEAKYKGREVKLGKPTRGDVAKYKVYVRDPKTGNIKKVNFGDKKMEIKRDDPKRRKSFRARHNCSQKKDRTTAGYWSCRMWSSKPVSKIVEE